MANLERKLGYGHDKVGYYKWTENSKARPFEFVDGRLIADNRVRLGRRLANQAIVVEFSGRESKGSRYTAVVGTMRSRGVGAAPEKRVTKGRGRNGK